MSKLDNKDIYEFTHYVLLQEQQQYKENPVQSESQKIKKRKDFLKKLTEIANGVARRENINIED